MDNTPRLVPRARQVCEYCHRRGCIASLCPGLAGVPLRSRHHLLNARGHGPGAAAKTAEATKPGKVERAGMVLW